MRAFVAIQLPDPVIDALGPVQDALNMGRVVPSENLHITLAFLDDQPEMRLEALHEELECITVPAFDQKFDGVDTLGGTSPRIACAVMDNNATLRILRDKVRGAARNVDITLPRERFRPHVTLARFRRDMGHDQTLKLRDVLAGLGGLSLPTFEVTCFALIQSQLLPEGPRYETLASYPLRLPTA